MTAVAVHLLGQFFADRFERILTGQDPYTLAGRMLIAQIRTETEDVAEQCARDKAKLLRDAGAAR
jgi:hypothetical protein